MPDICGRLLAAGKPANTPAAIIEQERHNVSCGRNSQNV
ncbi:hypothetical protein B4113_2937 [Geobacillus sp. B4113_201601]|nr:hypothetical protein B4113_2937 [Geobacillus sp. B4113_201601]